MPRTLSSATAPDGPAVNGKAPMLSVCMITYNHEEFIARAIESVLMQETDFDFELVVGEDCSTDRTRAIVLEYGLRHPDRVRPVMSETNVGSKRNEARVLRACRGKYVALLEGDDYWTSPNKLQKQVDFLEANPDFVMCGHDVDISFQGDVNRTSPFKRDFPQIANFDTIWRKFFIPTPSLVFRNHTIRELPEWYYRIQSGDMAFNMMLAHHGKCYYMFEKMAVKHRHPGGVTETANFRDRLKRLTDELTIRKGVLDYAGRRREPALTATVAGLHRRISVEYFRRKDPLKSALHLAAALFMSGRVRRDVLFAPVAARIPGPVRLAVRTILTRRAPQTPEQRGAN